MQKATLKRARVHNSRLVLRTIYAEGPISRADVARITHLTPPTVSDVVSELISNKLVREIGSAPSSSGRRAILIEVAEDSHLLIGIDLSRQDFRGALADLRGKIRHRIDLPLQDRDGDAALTLVYDLVDTLVESSKSPLLGVGIGAPGLVDSTEGVLQQSVNLNWRYVPLRKLLQKRYNLPVYMANDCQVAALAVHKFYGSGNNEKSMVVINVGWGVGSGIISQGQLLQSSPVGVGEIGHVTVIENGDLCACGNRGCLETVASSRAIIKRFRNLVENNPHSYSKGLLSDPARITLISVLEAFHSGNEDARKVILEAGIALGIAVANLVGVLGSCHVLLRGDVVGSGQFLIDTMTEEMSRRTLPSLARSTEIGIADVGPDIVIQGASALILQNELGVL